MAANKAHPEALGAEVGLVVVCGPCVTEIKQSVASFRAKFANTTTVSQAGDCAASGNKVKTTVGSTCNYQRWYPSETNLMPQNMGRES
ncbi:hypothetical protein UVI_02030840 [Ustilaginoidea virens]|uniref:Uncharacterized protein n=1 Tax=Ustilaginoidea virens TaxID=1159556 RepID=A0A1B5L5R3_USTVR|nr:hypothetical protein UVI_02030840 [Ustilaginoidea virens]